MALPLSGLYQAQAAGTRYVFLKGPWPRVVDTDDQLSVSPTYDVMLSTWTLWSPLGNTGPVVTADTSWDAGFLHTKP